MSHQRYFMFFGLLLYQFYNRKTVKNKKYSENISEYPTLWPEKFYNKKLSVIYHIFPFDIGTFFFKIFYFFIFLIQRTRYKLVEA